MTLPILEVLTDLQRDPAAYWLQEHVEAHHMAHRTTRKTAGYFHASQLGQPDDVLIAQYRGTYEDDVSPTLQRIFENGHDRHRGISRTMHETGLSIFEHWDGPEADAERRCVLENLKARGTCDDVIKHPETGEHHVLEFKSINPFGFSQLREPKPEHVMQVHVYMAALALSDSIVLYESKSNQAWLAFHQRFDINVWAQIVLRLKRLRRMAEQGIKTKVDEATKRKAAALA